MMESIVSIVMICRDGARFLPEALESLAKQSLADWELLFVDDGSVDRSCAIVDEFSRRYSGQVQLLRHPGGGWRGTGPSRNLGLAAARSPFVTFLDVDDVYESARLERHVECLERNPGLGVVLSRELYWHRWPGSQSGKRDHVVGPAAEYGVALPPPGLLAGTLLTRGAALPNPGSMTLRRSHLHEEPIPPLFTSYYEDQALICRVLLSSWALVLQDSLLKYRQHSSSLTGGNNAVLEEPGTVVDQHRGMFLNWLRGQLLSQSVVLGELVEHLDRELGTRKLAAAPTRASTRRRGRPRWVEVFRNAQRRAAVMTHVWRLAAPDAMARSYWNGRVDDLDSSPRDRASRAYFRRHDAYRHAKAPYLAAVLNYDAWRGQRVLDLGCGIGMDIVRFAAAGAEVTGVDLSEVALDLARRNCEMSGVRATLLQADASRLPLRSESFDFVEAVALLPYVRDPAALVAEVVRVLRPGGLALFMTYHSRSWMTVVASLSGGLGGHADAPHFRLFSRLGLQRLLAPMGEVKLWTDRFPGQGPAARPGLRLLAGVWKTLPPTSTRHLGWHLLAECRKAS